MTSMRKLRRRLLRWQRYSTATGIHWVFGASDRRRAKGHFRALEAVADLQYRREVAAEQLGPRVVTEYGLEEAGLL